MGVSTDAIVFFGYAWTEEVELFPDADAGEWTERVLLGEEDLK